MSAWIEKFINVNPYSRSGKKLTAVKKLVVHYTANPGATAQNHFDYFNKLKDRFASAHIFIDRRQALNIIPLTEVAYHANDIQKKNKDGSPWRGLKELLPNANYLSIGVELCVEKDGTFHPETIALAVLVFADLCKKFNLTADDIVRHYDITAKNCPAPWVKDGQAFVDFKNKVAAELKPKKPALWDGKPLQKGQIGRLTILKPINVYKRSNDKLVTSRVAQKGEELPVFEYDTHFYKAAGQYRIVNNLWITNIPGFVKYETPSKALLDQVNK
jgi:N-acetylmuramoyl-L-alanine amidase